MNNVNHIDLKIGKGQYFSEIFLTCDLLEISDYVELTDAYIKLLGSLEENRITPIYEKVFGRLDHYHEFMNIRNRVYQKFSIESSDVAISYIEGVPADPHCNYGGIHLYGIQIHHTNMVTIDTLLFSDKCIGKSIKTKDFEQAFLMSVTGTRIEAEQVEDKINREYEFNRLFHNLDKMLNHVGFQITDLIRTWIYMPQLFEVYKTLNVERTNAFKNFNINKKNKKVGFPASTGIKGEAISGNAVTLDAIAVKTKGSYPVLTPMHNPMQSEAYAYGSDFSRGYVIDWPGYQVLHLSGTASIDENGNSVFIDNPKKQIEYTLESFLKLLNQYGSDFQNIAHACVFFKNRSYKKLFEEVLCNRGWSEFPCMYLEADVCREDLLFEIDGIAVVEKNSPEA